MSIIIDGNIVAGSGSNLSTLTKKGNYVTFPDTKDGFVSSANIEGKSIQNITVQGKNLCNSEIELGVIANDGINQTASSLITFRTKDYIKVTSGETYVMSVDNSALTPNGVYGYDANKIFVSATFSTSLSNKAFKSIIPENVKYIRFSGRHLTINTDLTPFLPIYGQVEINTIKTPYAPFIPNSPSPDYPSPIKSILEDGNLEINVCNTNLCNPANLVHLADVDGVLKENVTNYHSCIVRVKPNTTYTVNKTMLTNKLVVYLLDEYPIIGSTVKKVLSFGTSYTYGTFTTQQETSYVLIYFLFGNGNYPLVQLEEGSVANPVKSYEGKTYKTQIIEPLRNLGGVSDELDVLNGIVTRKIKEFIATGSENWGNIPSFDNDITTCFNTFPFIHDRSENHGSIVRSNQFKYYPNYTNITDVTSIVEGIAGYGFVNYQSNYIYIRINNDRLNDVTDSSKKTQSFKSYLKEKYDTNNPVIVQYILTDPIIEYVNPHQIKTLLSQTNIYTNSEDSQTVLYTTKDTKVFTTNDNELLATTELFAPSINITIPANILSTEIANKLDKIEGKQLSQNDYTSEDKDKLDIVRIIDGKLDADTLNGKSATGILQTTSKTNLIDAINEAYTSGGGGGTSDVAKAVLDVGTQLPDKFQTLTHSDYLSLIADGTIDPNIVYMTTDDSTTGGQIDKIGNLNDLKTTAKNNVVSAINEVDSDITKVERSVAMQEASMTNLSTTVTTMNGNVSRNGSDIINLKSDTIDLNKKVVELNKNFGVIDENITTIGTDLTTLTTSVDNKVDKITGKQLSANDFTTAEKTKLAGISALATHTPVIDNLTSTATSSALSSAQGKILKDTKVDIVSGKQLSTNDYTTAEKTKLSGIATGANVNIQTDWNGTTLATGAILNKPTSLPADGGNATTVNNKTATGTLNTTEKTDLITAINEVKTLADAGGSGVKNILDGNGTSSLISISANKSSQMNTGSISLGNNTNSTGLYSFAMGSDTNSIGGYSTTFGLNTTARGSASFAIGYLSNANGSYSIASGLNNLSSGANSATFGNISTASGVSAFASGTGVVASGDYSHAQNQGTIAQGRNQTTIGMFNVAQGVPDSTSTSNQVFIIGNGTDNNARSNALTVTFDGVLDVAKDIRINNTPLITNILDGNVVGSSRSSNSPNVGSMGTNAIQLGLNSKATAVNSFAMGNTASAIGAVSISLGGSTVASNDYAFASGVVTLASGYASNAQNLYTTAQGHAQTTIGKYNIAQGTPGNFVATDHAFIVGNGNDVSTRSNALSLTWDGTLNVAKDVKINNSISLLDLSTKANNFVYQNGSVFTNFSQADINIIAPKSYNSILIGTGLKTNKTSNSGGDILVGQNIGKNTVLSPADSLNICIGHNILQTTPIQGTNSIRGIYVGFSTGNIEGQENCAIGDRALSFGLGSDLYKITGDYNTAIGPQAFSFSRTLTPNNQTINESTAIGYGASVTASNQLQLGGSRATIYGASAYNVRSDARDKTDITDLTYKYVDFIKNIKPRNYRIDQREDYCETVKISEEAYDLLLDEEKEEYEYDGNIYLKEVVHAKDNSRKRKRLHNGFIAQEIKEVADSLEFDFAGYQDHKLVGGGDIHTLAYEEFISPLVATVQHLLSKVEYLEEELNKQKGGI